MSNRIWKLTGTLFSHAVAAALSAVSTKGDATVQIGLIDWALREISLHWPGGDDDDAEGEG